jgi:hypothetical protein
MIIHGALEVGGDLVILGSAGEGTGFFGAEVELSRGAGRAGFLAWIGDRGEVRWRWLLERVQVLAIARWSKASLIVSIEDLATAY